MVAVTSPVEGYNGTVVGVEFSDGKASVERSDVQALAYFQRHGYGIAGDQAPAVAPAPPDPRDVGHGGDGVVHVGTHLRDAAVDPSPADFLPPTNAGAENPHGPKVVSPGLHGTPPGPIVPGPVSDNAATQQEVETAAAVDALTAGGGAPEDPATAEHDASQTSAATDIPAVSSKVGEWRTYAIAHGMDPAEAEVATKAELVERYK